MKTDPTDDESFIELIQSKALERSPKLVADKRAELYCALDEQPATGRRLWFRLGLLTSAGLACLLLLLTLNLNEPTAPTLPPQVTSVTHEKPIDIALEWDISDQVGKRLNKARSSSLSLANQFSPENKSFKTRTRSLKSKLETLRKEIG